MVEKILTLSTAHIHDSWDFGNELRVQPHEHGIIVFLGSVDGKDSELELIGAQPLWLQPIVREAFDKGCTYIDFDADAVVMDAALPTYDEYAST